MSMTTQGDEVSKLKRITCTYQNDYGNDYPAYATECDDGEYYFSDQADALIEKLQAENAALRQRVAELEKDAERWSGVPDTARNAVRWLRNHYQDGSISDLCDAMMAYLCTPIDPTEMEKQCRAAYQIEAGYGDSMFGTNAYRIFRDGFYAAMLSASAQANGGEL